MMLKRTRYSKRNQATQEDHISDSSNGIEMFNENVCRADNAHMLPESSSKQSLVMQQKCDFRISHMAGLKKHSEAQNKRQKKENKHITCSDLNTIQATADEIEFDNFHQIDKGGQAFYQRNRKSMSSF